MQRFKLQLLLKEVLETGYLIGGPFIEELENKIQFMTGIKHCITVGNATDAMEIIFNFLDLPFNSKVLVPSHTMLATASAARSANLIPIPVDVDPDSLMLEIQQLEKCNLEGISACMITQLNGVVADMEPIKAFCDSNKIFLIEDSAQGIGAFNGEKHSGSWGLAVVCHFILRKLQEVLEMAVQLSQITIN